MDRRIGLTGMAAGAALMAVAAKVEVGEMTLPTYPFSDPDPVPNPSADCYPYFRYDGYAAKSSPKTWQTVTLENDRIRVVVTPEVGGKVWGAVDLATGVDFVYFNHVAKFRDVSMRGPWSAGGIEFNFGKMGHEPYTSAPVDWCVRTNTDGSVSCFVGGTEWLCRTFWQVEIRLREGERAFETRSTWFNASGLTQTYYQWMNAAFHGGDGTRYHFPGRNWIGHAGEAHPWPQEDGHDLADYSGNDVPGYAEDHRAMHVLNGDARHFGVWWPHLNAGAAHFSATGEKYGRKIWMWGLSRQGAIWERLLTDADGPYVELQSGRAFQQPQGTCWKTPFKHPSFAPGTTDTFAERWAFVADRAELAYMEAGEQPEPRPVKMPDDFDWDSAYGLYLRGTQTLRQGRDPDPVEAERLLVASRAKDRCFVPTLNALAGLYVSQGRGREAKECVRTALAVDAYDGEANYLDGLLLATAGETASALDRLGLAAYDPRVRSAAAALAARLNLGCGDWTEAERLAAKALDANRLNLDARAVQVIAARKRGATDAARRLACAAQNEVPLHHLFRVELERLGVGRAADAVRNEFPEKTWTELGSWYETCGLLDEALDLYARAKGSILASVRAAHVAQRQGDAAGAAVRLQAAATLSLGFDFPFRAESFAALGWAAAQGVSWKFRYLHALLLAHKARFAEAADELRACGPAMDDVSALLYRAQRLGGDAARADLAQAARLGDSWRVGLGRYAEAAKEGRWDEARHVLEGYVRRYPGQLGLELNYARALIKTGAQAEAVAFLETLDTLPSELGEKPIALYQEALGALADAALSRGDEAAASAYIRKALSTPETLGAGRQFRDDRVIDSWPARVRAFARRSAARHTAPYDIMWPNDNQREK